MNGDYFKLKQSEIFLHLAIKKFDSICSDFILEKQLNLKLKRVKYKLTDATIVYIQYNNYNEYSYSVIYSHLDQDLCRFDNYDQHWDVSTRPHHFHPRKNYDAQKSPMKGAPSEDMEELCRFLNTKN
jgi:Family of unknown function (DUF6516)